MAAIFFSFFFFTSELKLFSLVPGENCVAAILICSYSKLRKQKGSKTSAYGAHVSVLMLALTSEHVPQSTYLSNRYEAIRMTVFYWFKSKRQIVFNFK